MYCTLLAVVMAGLARGRQTAARPGRWRASPVDLVVVTAAASVAAQTSSARRRRLEKFGAGSVGWRCMAIRKSHETTLNLTLLLYFSCNSTHNSTSLLLLSAPACVLFPGSAGLPPTLRRTRTLSHPALSLSSGSMPPCAHHHELWRTALLANESWSTSRPTCSTSELTYPTRGSVCPSGSVYHSGNAIPIPWSLSVPEMSPFRPS